MAPRARIIAIGDEILLGRIVDTNGAWLAARCADWGLRLVGSETVGDIQDQIEAAMARACAGAEVVLVTGGLGPTVDDRTRDALAALLGVALAHSVEAWSQVEHYYRSIRKREAVPESNRRQALIPAGASVLANDRGTAPGLYAEHAGAVIACLPGVPHEMQAMAARLAPRLAAAVPGLRVPHIEEVWFGGLGESQAQDMLGELLLDDTLQVGICAHEDYFLTVRVVGERERACDRAAAVRAVMRDYLLPQAGFAPSLVTACRERGWTITAAESCSVGQLTAALGRVGGVSAVLRRSLIAYHNDVKRDELGVSEELLREHGAVSEPVVAAMARGARERSGADLALATSGIAGPSGGTPEKPVGTVWVAAADGAGVSTELLHLVGERVRIQRRAAVGALMLGWRRVQRR